jgi:hypothetical protein
VTRWDKFWTIFFSLGTFFRLFSEAARIHGKNIFIYLDEKTGWATFWAIFSLGHLVTLI